MEPEQKVRVQVRKDFKSAEGAQPDVPVLPPTPAAPVVVTAPSKIPGLLIGNRFVTPDDGPVEVDHDTAERLIKEGAVEAVGQMPGKQPEHAAHPKPGGPGR